MVSSDILVCKQSKGQQKEGYYNDGKIETRFYSFHFGSGFGVSKIKRGQTQIYETR